MVNNPNAESAAMKYKKPASPVDTMLQSRADSESGTAAPTTAASKVLEARSKADILKAVTEAVCAAKAPGVDASQEEIAKAVMDGMGVVFGENPFVQKSSMSGWGGGRG
jgi:hypothetical protein